MCLNTIKRLEAFLSNEEKDALYDCLKEIGIRVREYWEAVSGNGVNKIMENIEKFLQVLPERNTIKDIKAILKQILEVYSLILKLNWKTK
uniref:Transposase n=1 Tax=Rhabditophanes sp. KR3021 TaxID=114890 RepID=A0AC35UER1_9BILA